MEEYIQVFCFLAATVGAIVAFALCLAVALDSSESRSIKVAAGAVAIAVGACTGVWFYLWHGLDVYFETGEGASPAHVKAESIALYLAGGVATLAILLAIAAMRTTPGQRTGRARVS